MHNDHSRSRRSGTAPVFAVLAALAAIAGCSSTRANEDGHERFERAVSAVGGGVRTGNPNGTATGSACVLDNDCYSGNCQAKVCQVETCSDGILNGNESDRDCGGGTCAKCALDKQCFDAAQDCEAVAPDGAATTCFYCMPSAANVAGDCNIGRCEAVCGNGKGRLCYKNEGCWDPSDCVTDAANPLGSCVNQVCQSGSVAPPVKSGDETDVGCGGSKAPACADLLHCLIASDCKSGVCTGTVCQVPTSTDRVKNGNETDVDCGGTSTKAPTCARGLRCGVDDDCGSKACNYAGKCVERRSCKAQHGGDTCGAAGSESCCVSLPAGAATIDKYNITAGRMRAFVTATDGDLRGYITANTPAWWNAAWTSFLPNVLDNGNVSPDDAPAFSGVYQELGPYVHGTAAGANEGCYVSGTGARTYRLPDAVNARMGDRQEYTQAFLDDRPLNCVTPYMLAAFCAWDGGWLPTRQELDVAWGADKYPWGAQAPAGYDLAYGIDPDATFGRESYGPIGSTNSGTAPFVSAPFAKIDIQWANYNYNYWGGASQVGSDYSIFLAPPGRFPNGNSATGHADLAGSVFNATDIVGANVYWSRSGSWQGHQIPYTAKGSWATTLAANKYWAMGGRCARK